MALTVQNYNPGTISGVTSGTNRKISGVTPGNPGTISGVSYANPGKISGVVSNYGMQQQPWISQPFKLGGVNSSPTTPGMPKSTDSGYAALEAQNKRLEALLNPVYAPKLDLSSINAQARKQAEAAVNPLYTRRLNDMLARKAVEKSRNNQDYQTNVAAIQKALQESQDASNLQRGRTTEDTATALGDINIGMDRFQTDTGQQFDADRIAQAQQLASTGMTSSGAGQQQMNQANQAQNITEGRQEEDAQRKRVGQTLIKARTFEDLATSDILATERGKTNTTQAKLDLDRAIEDIDYETERERYSLEDARFKDVSSQTSGYSQTLVNNFISSIKDPAQRQAALQAYGGIF